MSRAVALLLLALGSGYAAAAEPFPAATVAGSEIASGPREGVCQHGFEDDGVGWGYTLSPEHQLGIHCAGPITITRVGFYTEMGAPRGYLDVVIRDHGAEVQRTNVWVEGLTGNHEFDIPDIEVGDACVVLCPVDPYWALTGEDYDSGPIESFTSTTCGCETLLDCNLMIWAITADSPTAVPAAWGSLGTPYPRILSVAPNPAASSGAEVLFETNVSGALTMTVHDVGGRLIRSVDLGQLEPGRHQVRFDGRDAAGLRLASGMYFLRLRNVAGESAVARMLLLR